MLILVKLAIGESEVDDFLKAKSKVAMILKCASELQAVLKIGKMTSQNSIFQRQLRCQSALNARTKSHYYGTSYMAKIPCDMGVAPYCIPDDVSCSVCPFFDFITP